MQNVLRLKYTELVVHYTVFKYGHHRIIQKIIFKMIPRSLHIKDSF